MKIHKLIRGEGIYYNNQPPEPGDMISFPTNSGEVSWIVLEFQPYDQNGGQVKILTDQYPNKLIITNYEIIYRPELKYEERE